jgi:hypothetical protein
MIWFLERNTDLLICEIRHSSDGPAYEFEIAASQGPPDTQRFASAADLIQGYLRKQTVLQAQGWRPRIGEIQALEE